MPQDIRFALRSLAKSPGFTFIAVFTLAIGIGVNTAIFAIVHAVVLRPLPFENPDRLVTLNNQFLATGLTGLSTSVRDYLDYREQKQVFSEVATMEVANFTMSGNDRPERVLGTRVSAGFLPMMGIRPIMGRVFLEGEDTPEGRNVAILDEGLWKRSFGASPDVIGKTIRLNEVPHTIIGVVPPSFSKLAQIEVVVPTGFTEAQKAVNQRSNQFLFTIGRLRDGVTLEQARGHMDRFAAELMQRHPNHYPKESGYGISMKPLNEIIMGEKVKPVMMMLLAAVGLVLLIACANVANLLLARAGERMREVSIRASLGATRWRLVRQLMTESLLLGIFGSAAGLLIATWGISWFVQTVPRQIPRVAEIGLHPEILAFTAGLSMLTAVLFGAMPALRLALLNLHDALKEAGRSSSDSNRRHRARAALVVAEVGLSIVLLVGAGLMVSSLSRMASVDTGFEPRNLMTFTVALPAMRYNTVEATSGLYQRIAAELGRLPGVRAVGGTHSLPFSGQNSSSGFEVEGRTVAEGAIGPHADVRVVMPDYFAALGMPLKQGRTLSALDSGKSPRVVVIDDKVAQQFWPNEEEPIGKRIRSGGEWHSIAGVVGHVKHTRLDAESRGAVYYSALQRNAQAMSFVIRTHADPASVAYAVPGVIASIDSELPAFEIRTMIDRIGASMIGQRLAASMLSIFGVLATVLAAVGLYGVVAQSVAQRTREIGIRMALGAAEGAVLRMVMRQGMTVVAVGVAVGIGLALVLSKSVSKLLFEVKPTDPFTYVTVSALLIAVAALAIWVPARRAARVNPLVALRYE